MGDYDLLPGLIVFILWLAFSLVVANSANKSGRSYNLFLIISVIFSPVVGGIVLAIANAVREEKSLSNEAEEKKSNLDSYISKADALKKYKELLDDGVITQEEFETKKQQILDS